MPREFKGEIKLDVRESTPDRDAFLADVEAHLAAAMARD